MDAQSETIYMQDAGFFPSQGKEHEGCAMDEGSFREPAVGRCPISGRAAAQDKPQDSTRDSAVDWTTPVL
jgi:hypothetical protein